MEQSYMWKKERKINLENNEEGEEDQHKEQQAAGVQREEVIFVWEIRLRRKRTINKTFLYLLAFNYNPTAW